MKTRQRCLLLVAGLLMAGNLALAIDHTTDSLDTVKQSVAGQKALIVDVREQSEWDEGHLAGAKLVPLSKLRTQAKSQEFVDKLNKDVPKDKIIYCHCRAGVRAIGAGEILKELGYDVRPLKAGYEELIEAGFLQAKPREMQTRARADGKPQEKTAIWDPAKTAVVIVDMWDDHHCKSAAERVTQMAPHMNEVVKAARQQGMLIVHAPSDCMDFYRDTPARKNALAAPRSPAPVKFQWNYFNAEREGPLAAKLEQGGCSCDLAEPCSPSFRAWKRQIATIEIADQDAVSADGQEVYNLLQARGIDNVIVMGVHTNRCVLGRPFGIRQMVYLGKNVVLCRDLTDSYHRDPGAHFEGLEKIVEHVEQYWCPTITSQSITGKAPFKFPGDKRA